MEVYVEENLAAGVHAKTKVRGRRGRQRSQMKQDTVHETPEVKDMLSGNMFAALAAAGIEDAVASDSDAVEVERVGAGIQQVAVQAMRSVGLDRAELLKDLAGIDAFEWSSGRATVAAAGHSLTA